EYIVEVYGTRGSLRWNFHRLNELEFADTADGYRTIMSGPNFGDFSRFQPGAGTGMGFDNLKAIEAYLFLKSVVETNRYAPAAGDGSAAAEVADAAVERAESRQGVDIKRVDVPTTYGRKL